MNLLNAVESKPQEEYKEEVKNSHFLPLISPGRNHQNWTFKDEIPEADGDEDSAERERSASNVISSLNPANPVGEDPNDYVAPPSLDNDDGFLESQQLLKG